MANPGPPYIVDLGDRWTRKVELGKVGLQTLAAFHGQCTLPTHSPNTYLSRRAPRGQRACSPALHAVNFQSADAGAVDWVSWGSGTWQGGRRRIREVVQGSGWEGDS